MQGLELIWVTVIGAAIGAVLRYVLPRRGSYGILLLPAVGAAVTAAVWVVLVWLGWAMDEPWIWLVSLGAAAVVSALVALLTAPARAHRDAELLHRLSGGRA